MCSQIPKDINGVILHHIMKVYFSWVKSKGKQYNIHMYEVVEERFFTVRLIQIFKCSGKIWKRVNKYKLDGRVFIT